MVKQSPKARNPLARANLPVKFQRMVWVNQFDERFVRLVPCWAPSVVEAIVKCNQTWLTTSPLQRDPTVFTATESAEGHASRAMAYKM